ncbi:MAG: hypothetical protein F6J87_10555 [Spirulina sp. SIO3F2]|nr:hypothetical protein [Spirulina sp. SIO3F2]
MTDSASSEIELTRHIQRILQTQTISREAHFKLVSRCLTDIGTSPEQRREINQVLDYVQMGKIKIESPLASPNPI